ncbi:glycosyltransferase involved in cell wall biosynthesis [Desulfitispora alkaliphila]|uniref:glycosyltransferase family 2 protein n=1 Tax=Desulfitispora alkaliphila TaxID=622674 RepID=UPI003D197962
MVTVLIPAYNEERRIAQTVRGIKNITMISEIIVVSDGSADNTANKAREAGADLVLELTKNKGKGKALNVALDYINTDIVALIDADLGETSGEIEKLLKPVIQNEADLTIAIFPHSGKKSGFGWVKRLANWGGKKFADINLTEPLSGQRVLNKKALNAVTPWANGFGMEVAMNISAAKAELRIKEVETRMSHKVTGRNISGFYHRGRQLVHVLKALMYIRGTRV